MPAVKPKRGHPWKATCMPPKGPKQIRPNRDYSERKGAIFGKRYGQKDQRND